MPKLLLKKITVLSLFLAQFSCTKGKLDPYEKLSGLTRSEINDTLFKNHKDEKLKKANLAKNEAPIPGLSKLITSLPPPVIGGDKTISFSVTDQVPLKDVLIELGRVAKIDTDLDPTISGGIILNAKNRPLKEVIDRIATLGKLRYTYQNGVLHFERDTPYMKNYFVDYLIDGQLWSDVETNISAIFATSATPSSADSTAATSTSSFSSNKSAGIISIFATDKEHETITKYLADVQKTASAQVLIEAKIVEVTLSDTYKTGIDWSRTGNQNTVTSFGNYTATGSAGSAITLVASELFNSDLSASVSALKTFGLAKAISSPRISTLNNQKATLNFVTKGVYFTVATSQAVSVGTSTTTSNIVTATKNELDTGSQLEITPSVNLATGEITLSVKPTLTVDSGVTASDPTTNPSTGESLGNTIPIVNTRTLSTIAKIKSGNVLVIGGLMSDTTTNSDSGVPFLSRIPFLGWLFKSVSEEHVIVETVIFIKATIVNSGSTAPKTDRDIHEKFDVGKRPFFNN